MTLFKRVFNSHTHGSSTSKPIAVPEDDADLEGPFHPDPDFKTAVEAAGSDPFEDDLLRAQDDAVGEDEDPGAAASEDPFADVFAEAAPSEDIGDTDPLDAGPMAALAPRLPSKPMLPRKSERRPLTTYEVKSVARAEGDPQSDLQIEKVCQMMEEEQQRAPAPREVAPSRPLAAEPAAPGARPGRNARRVRTRMLGFDAGLADAVHDPFKKDEDPAQLAARTHPVGWIVVTEGPGQGHAFGLYNGVSTIGRGTDQAVALDFGDTSISREKHAAIAYDDESNSFFLGHGGKSNIVRLNNRPVLSTEDLQHGDEVRLGETTLRFVALCGADFAWGTPSNAKT
ncbi:MAG: FHA domain-containing protein [Pseudomonadota bacterium]